MGFILKILPFIVLFYIIFTQFDKRVLKEQELKGVLKGKFLEKNNTPKSYFNSSLTYFKEKEKYFIVVQVGEYLVTEQVTKEVYSELVIDEPINLVKYYTKITNKLIKVVIR